MPQKAVPNSPSERLVAIDALRVLAFALLMLYHLGMAYVPDWGWHIKSHYQSPWLQSIMLWSNQWRMDLLFVLSGMAVAIMLQRKPTLTVGRLRIVHLGVPLLAGVFIWVAPQVFVELKDKGFIAGMGYIEFLLHYLNPFGELPAVYGRFEPLPWTWNHLWFLPYVLCYSLITVVIAGVFSFRARFWQPSRRWWFSAGLLLVPVLVLWLIGEWLYADFPKSYAFIGDWFNHASYGWAFLLGVIFVVLPALWQQLPRLYVPALVLAIACFLMVLVYVGKLPIFWDEALYGDFFTAIKGFVFSANRWLWLLAVLTLGARYFVVDYPWLTPLRQRIFCYYIIHQSVLIVGLWALKERALGWAEPTLLLLGTLLLCELGYRCACRSRILGYSLGVFPKNT